MKITKKTMGTLVGGVAVTLLLTFGLRTGYAAALVDTYFVGFPSVSIQQNRDGSVNATIDATYVDDDATVEQFPVSQCFATVPGHDEKADDPTKTGGTLGFIIWKPGISPDSTNLSGCSFDVNPKRGFFVPQQTFHAVSKNRGVFIGTLPIGLHGGPALVSMSVDSLPEDNPPGACGTFRLHADLLNIDPAGGLGGPGVTASPDDWVILDLFYGNEKPGTSGACFQIEAEFSKASTSWSFSKPR
jgi:hypothetical protein